MIVSESPIALKSLVSADLVMAPSTDVPLLWLDISDGMLFSGRLMPA